MMTDEDLKNLVAENSRGIREMRIAQDKQQAESEKDRTESEKNRTEWKAESAKHWAESEKNRTEWKEESEKNRAEWKADSEKNRTEWKEESEKNRAEMRAIRQEMLMEIRASRQETDRLFAYLERRFDKLSAQVGQIGNQIGLTTEAMFYPSLERILREDFDMEVVRPRVKAKLDGETIEIDALAHTDEVVYIAEIKTQLKPEGLQQILKHLRRFPKLFPEHRGKKVFGILGALQIPEQLRTQVLKEGIFLATIRDDVFEIVRPDKREPRAFSA
jgi:hypothetical protein